MTVRLFSDLLSVLQFAKGEKTELVLKLGEAATPQSLTSLFLCISDSKPGPWNLAWMHSLKSCLTFPSPMHEVQEADVVCGS